jgi:DNA-binding response OmpR family regulator
MSKRAILVVDDSAVILAAVERALTAAGYEVTTASSLDELAPHGLAERFDLILMDVEMTELYGDEVAAILRHHRGVKTPIYLFSSVEESQLAELARAAAIDGYITKQAGMDALVLRIREILD